MAFMPSVNPAERRAGGLPGRLKRIYLRWENGGLWMDAVIVMCLGVLVGRFFVPIGVKRGNEFLSLACTFLLIFSMGVKLGGNEHFFEELTTLGLSSLLFFFVPTLCSIVVVYLLTQKFMKKKNDGKGAKR